MPLETAIGEGDERWDEIGREVREITAEAFGREKEEIRYETSFVEDLKADSLDTVELVMKLEEEYEVTIPGEEAEKIRTVRDAVNRIFEIKYLRE